MRINLSPAAYLALCGLVKDALEVESDAAPVLRMAALELASAAGTPDEIPEEIMERVDGIIEMRESALEKKSA